MKTDVILILLLRLYAGEFNQMGKHSGKKDTDEGEEGHNCNFFRLEVRVGRRVRFSAGERWRP